MSLSDGYRTEETMLRKIKKPLLLSCRVGQLCVALLTAVPCLSFAAAAPQIDTKVETRITADNMSYHADRQQVIFINDVHVKRPDFQLWADRLTVYLEATPKTETSSKSLHSGLAAGDIEKIVADKNVRISSEDYAGTGSKVTYTVKDGVLQLEGSPKISDGENTITGDVIKYFTKENRSEVLGGQRRVEAVFSSSGSSSSFKASDKGKP